MWPNVNLQWKGLSPNQRVLLGCQFEPFWRALPEKTRAAKIYPAIQCSGAGLALVWAGAVRFRATAIAFSALAPQRPSCIAQPLNASRQASPSVVRFLRLSFTTSPRCTFTPALHTRFLFNFADDYGDSLTTELSIGRPSFPRCSARFAKRHPHGCLRARPRRNDSAAPSQYTSHDGIQPIWRYVPVPVGCTPP